jgi:hypothetical protein
MAAARAAQTGEQLQAARATDAARKHAERAQETPLQREQRLAARAAQAGECSLCAAFLGATAQQQRLTPRAAVRHPAGHERRTFLYKAAYAAQKAAASAKQRHERLQTAQSQQAVLSADASFVAARTAAEACMEALQLAGDRCEPYAAWAEAEQRREQQQQVREQQYSLERRADGLLATWGQHPAASQASVLQQAREVVQQLWPHAERQVQGQLESVQLCLRRLQAPVAAAGGPGALAKQRYEWQAQQLQQLQDQVQQRTPQAYVRAPAANVRHPDPQREMWLAGSLSSCCKQLHRLHCLTTAITSREQSAAESAAEQRQAFVFM